MGGLHLHLISVLLCRPSSVTSSPSSGSCANSKTTPCWHSLQGPPQPRPENLLLAGLLSKLANNIKLLSLWWYASPICVGYVFDRWPIPTHCNFKCTFNSFIWFSHIFKDSYWKVIFHMQTLPDHPLSPYKTHAADYFFLFKLSAFCFINNALCSEVSSSAEKDFSELRSTFCYRFTFLCFFILL